MADEKELFSIDEIKALIKELGGYKKVAEDIGVTEKGLASSVGRGSIGNQTIKSILLLKENREMKEDLEIVKKWKEFLLKK